VSEPRDPNYVVKSTGLVAVNDHEQMTSVRRRNCVDQEEQGERAQRPQLLNHVMDGSGLFAANYHEQMSSEGGNAGPKNRQERPKEEYQKVYEVGYFEGHDSQHLLSLGLKLGDRLRQQEAHARRRQSRWRRRHSRWRWRHSRWKWSPRS
jgi:hypothetical protein